MMNRPQGKEDLDRVQRKRVQNREAQQKYRIRMKERIHALEDEIKELKGGKSHSPNHARRHQPTPSGGSSDTNMGMDDGMGGMGVNHITAGHGSISNNARNYGRPGSGGAYGQVTPPGTATAQPSPTRVLGPGQQQHQSLGFSQSLEGHGQITPTSQAAFELLRGFSPTPHLQSSPVSPEWPWQSAPRPAGESSMDTSEKPGLPKIATASSSSKHIRHEPVSMNETYEFLSQHDHRNYVDPDMSRHMSSASIDDGPSLSRELGDSPFFDAATPTSDNDMLSSLPPEGQRHSSAPTLENYSSIPGSATEQKISSRSLEERFEYVQLCLLDAGFSSIDDMFGQYYTADFSHESHISSRQRSSRHSELPLLLSRLRDDIEGWTQWEAHGYESEIIKSAASIIRAERADFGAAARQSYVDTLSKLGSGPDNAAQEAGAFRALMRSLQESMPKLWALTESLMASDQTLTQRERTYTSLSMMLLLCRPQQAPKQQMMAALTRCLDKVFGGSV
ncbi:hypothetical protein GE09DRAFT_718389 [Coniochaeta sp. 2T2.1]|nr:hypothetical protein GE09DRAFT_718389 [Coniochaeta sp. 2T2.1]